MIAKALRRADPRGARLLRRADRRRPGARRASPPTAIRAPRRGSSSPAACSRRSTSGSADCSAATRARPARAPPLDARLTRRDREEGRAPAAAPGALPGQAVRPLRALPGSNGSAAQTSVRIARPTGAPPARRPGVGFGARWPHCTRPRRVCQVPRSSDLDARLLDRRSALLMPLLRDVRKGGLQPSQVSARLGAPHGSPHAHDSQVDRSPHRTGAPRIPRLGERLRQLRVGAGLTQGQLAGDRFSKEYISQIERGKTRPTAETIEWLALRLGVDAVVPARAASPPTSGRGPRRFSPAPTRCSTSTASTRRSRSTRRRCRPCSAPAPSSSTSAR